MHHPHGEQGESGSNLISVTRAFIVRSNGERWQITEMADNRSILVTGAAGRLGAVGRNVAELLLDRGLPVRAMVRREDDRAAALRAAGAEVVLGDLLEPADVYRVVNGCRRIYSGMSLSTGYLEPP
jgi:NAD(P)H dehydrogenase (quinone)